MSTGKKILYAIIALFIIIQFIRPERNINTNPQPGDIFVNHPASDSLQALVKVACYDCHSNNTEYPWYTNIQPAGLWMQQHVDEGKEELNFSEFTSYDAKRADHKLEEVDENVKEKKMPLDSYSWIHHDARLTDPQRKLITDWADSLRATIKL